MLRAGEGGEEKKQNKKVGVMPSRRMALLFFCLASLSTSDFHSRSMLQQKGEGWGQWRGVEQHACQLSGRAKKWTEATAQKTEQADHLAYCESKRPRTASFSTGSEGMCFRKVSLR